MPARAGESPHALNGLATEGGRSSWRRLAGIGSGRGGRPGSATADLARRPRARDEATRSGALPGLLRLGLWCSRGSRRGRLGWLVDRRGCGLGPGVSRQGIVLFETALLVFAARAAVTGLVTPRSSTGRRGRGSRSSHWSECTVLLVRERRQRRSRSRTGPRRNPRRSVLAPCQFRASARFLDRAIRWRRRSTSSTSTRSRSPTLTISVGSLTNRLSSSET